MARASWKVDPEVIKQRLPPNVYKSKAALEKAVKATNAGASMLENRDIRVASLREEGGLPATEANEIALRELQVICWQNGLLQWPGPELSTPLIMDIQMGMADNPIRLIQDDIADYAEIKAAKEAEELAAKEKEKADKAAARAAEKAEREAEKDRKRKLSDKLTDATELDEEEVSRQLVEGQGRQASLRECMQWVADNIDHKGAMPEQAPSNAAYSMLLAARDDRKAFFKSLQQMLAKDGDSSNSLSDPRYRDLEGALVRFTVYEGLRRDADLLRELRPIAAFAVASPTDSMRLTDERREIFARVLEALGEGESESD